MTDFKIANGYVPRDGGQPVSKVVRADGTFGFKEGDRVSNTMMAREGEIVACGWDTGQQGFENLVAVVWDGANDFEWVKTNTLRNDNSGDVAGEFTNEKYDNIGAMGAVGQFTKEELIQNYIIMHGKPPTDEQIYRLEQRKGHSVPKALELSPWQQPSLENEEIAEAIHEQHNDLPQHNGLTPMAAMLSYPEVGEVEGDGCSVDEDDDGVYVKTHRARSKSYPTLEDIPKDEKDFIATTASLVVRASLSFESREMSDYPEWTKITAKQDGVECGFIAVWTSGKLKNSVKEVWVDQDMRRQGIATQLWSEAKNQFPSLKHSKDQTDAGSGWASTTSAALWYDKNGDPMKPGDLVTIHSGRYNGKVTDAADDLGHFIVIITMDSGHEQEIEVTPDDIELQK